MKELIKPLFDFYGFPAHVKTNEQKMEYANEYVAALEKFKIADIPAVKAHILTNNKYMPKISQVIESINKLAPHRDTGEDWKIKCDEDRALQKKKAENRADIYRSNQASIDKIIDNGWGMDLACAITDMFMAAFRHGNEFALINDTDARRFFSPPRCMKLDPLDYFGAMPVNRRGQAMRFKHPVDFVKGVMS